MADEAPSTAAPSSASSRRNERAKRYGRRIAQGIYYSAITALALAFTVQITEQVFFPAPPSDKVPYDSCLSGLNALNEAIERGRSAASRSAPGEPNDEAALARYRAEVEHVWRHQPGVAALCRDADSSSLLDALERLRYSEEHGVRHEAAELTALRQRVRRMFTEQRSAAPLSPAPRRGQQ